MTASSLARAHPEPAVSTPPDLWEKLEAEANGKPQKIEDALLAEGVKESHVTLSLERVRKYGGTVAEVMLDFGIVSPETVARSIARSEGLAYFGPSLIDLIMAASWPAEVRAKATYNMIPVAVHGNSVMVAISGIHARAEARNHYYPLDVVPVIASEQTIQTAYRKLFAQTLKMFEEACAAPPQTPNYYNNILATLIRHACYIGASDIHFSPTGKSGLLRIRQDGTLQPVKALPIETYERVVGVIRNEGRINDLTTTAEASLTPPGELAERYHLRVQVSRSVRGETAVLRILDQQGSHAEFDSLGFDPQTAHELQELILTSAGLLIITGPTGSGKTTTLYSLLRLLDPMEVSIQSVENPVEYQCGAWNQYEIRRGAGANEGEEWLGWFKGLLRNDLDVALLGEVRDRETAKAAIEMANTGHLVLTTLHTNSTTRAVTRLHMMGLDMPSLSDVLIGVTAQRLVRKLCPVCRKPDDREDTLQEIARYADTFDFEPAPMMAGSGCSECGGTGYRGRQIVYELLSIDEEVRDLVAEGRGGSALLPKLPPERRMWGVGVRFVASGITSIDEIRRRVIRE